VVPSALTQRIIFKFLTNENVKPAEILTKVRAQLMIKRSRGHRCMTGISHLMKAVQRMKSCEDYIIFKESYDQRLSYGCGNFEASYSSIFW